MYGPALRHHPSLRGFGDLNNLTMTPILLVIQILQYLKKPETYGNKGIFLMMGNAGFYIINPRRVVLQEFGTHCPRGSGPSLTERSKVAGAHDSADGEAEPRPDTP